MKTYPLIEADVRSTADGYHLDVWQGILDFLGLPPETERIDIVCARAEDGNGKKVGNVHTTMQT